MPEQCAEIAILGAGPAGAHLASRLAAAGRDVVLFDPKGAWEKPCGGGVPTRALREFGFILKSGSYPRKLIDRITLISPLGHRVSVKLAEPFAIYSREVLNRLVLDRATDAGARFIRAGVTDFGREGDEWRLTTGDGGSWTARYLVGADGAASFTRRRLVGIFPKGDLALAFGYNVTSEPHSGPNSEPNSGPHSEPNSGPHSGPNSGPNSGNDADGEEAVVRFLKDFTGYLWAFPRPEVMNFGVASKLGERTSEELRTLLKSFVCDYYGGKLPDETRLNFFGAKIPTLEFGSWKELRTTGDGWALIGDAAGFADPITGEGIYYAFKSADLLADTLIAAGILTTTYENPTTEYERRWREEFGRDLEHASYRLPRFYRGYFFGQVFTDAVVRLARWHRGVRTVLIKTLVGEQSYVTLKRDLLRRAYQIF